MRACREIRCRPPRPFALRYRVANTLGAAVRASIPCSVRTGTRVAKGIVLFTWRLEVLVVKRTRCEITGLPYVVGQKGGMRLKTLN
jgi:hypothetical protein